MPAVHTTYSFTDINATMSHSSYGSYSIQGEGVGEMTITMNTDRTTHDVAADGHIMVSKIPGNNGTVTINAQQTSTLHRWLLGLYNSVWNGSTDQWAQISMTINAPKMQETIYCTGGAFVKVGDKSYQAQGQRVAWSLLFADIQQLPQ